MPKAQKTPKTKKVDYEPNKMTLAIAALGGVALVLVLLIVVH